ncbi:TRAP transporter substrate-binding protein [Neomoorella mulderi]|uniref:2,3-diketo-L-gulonate-binding periplasmic protein YiaO n=1 Tax=Moorella mulderi DSM 14980 TaxID=1122241 RepID=A0A151B0E3_9FIRM|nr:TRAP transporter substrate-binding protein [Moorella mulderi]KYH33356.1 2,3-diketo-L-gulonate-binding periplasmic protein YiaO precursor [Moorella mulderi DSM 14980]
MRRNNKKACLPLVFVLLIVMIMGLSGCGLSKSQPSEQGKANKETKIALKLGHIVTEKHSYHEGVLKFKELVEKNSNGQIEVQIFPNSSLGNERDLGEGLRIGTIEMALISTAVMQNFEPALGVFDLPYILRDWDHAHKAQDGEAGQMAAKRLLEKQNIRVLSYYDQGFRHVLGIPKPINNIEDLKGYKIRLPESPVFIDTFKALGASPTTIPWSEVYTALQTKVVDGMEGSPESLFTSKLHEVTKYYSLTNHIYAGAVLLISESVYKKLTPEQQKIILDAAKESSTYERKVCIERDNEYMQKMKDAGIKVNPITDLTPFQNAVKNIYEDFAKKVGPDGEKLVQTVIDTK